MVLEDLFFLAPSFLYPSTTRPPYFYPSIFVFTRPNDGWTGLYIKLWRTLTVHHTNKTKNRQCVYDRERILLEDMTETITGSMVARHKSLVPMPIITALGDSSRTTDSSPVKRSRVRPPEIVVKHGGKMISHIQVCTKMRELSVLNT